MQFAPAVVQFWLRAVDPSDVPSRVGEVLVAVDDSVPDARRASILEPIGAGGVARLTSAAASAAGVVDRQLIDKPALVAGLAASGVTLNDSDNLFYLPSATRAALLHEAVPSTRELTAADAEQFGAFQSESSEEDLDEAYVELDHWLVVGSFTDEGDLAAAASAYAWDDSTLADIGIITAPMLRGRGHASRAVRAISRAALERGYEPQYRCQASNVASAATARSAGFAQFATWEVVAGDDD